MKQCNRCRVEKPCEDFAKNRAAKDGLQARCRECSRLDNRESYHRNKELHKQYYRDNHKKIRERQKRYRAEHSADYKAISDRYRASTIGRAKGLWKAAQIRSQRIGVGFTLRFERVFDAVEKGVCERTGLVFDLKPHERMQNNPRAPSVDRVDPFGDYTDGNVQIVCVAYNIGKNQMTDDDFVSFCRLVVERHA